MAEQKEEQQSEAARKRSPNFPYSSVRDCVGYITRLHGELQQRKVPVFVAFGHMGLSPRSSSTDRIRAALSNYKLTQESLVFCGLSVFWIPTQHLLHAFNELV